MKGETGSRQVLTQKVESGEEGGRGGGLGQAHPEVGRRAEKGLWRPKGRRKRADAQTEV